MSDSLIGSSELCLQSIHHNIPPRDWADLNELTTAQATRETANVAYSMLGHTAHMIREWTRCEDELFEVKAQLSDVKKQLNESESAMLVRNEELKKVNEELASSSLARMEEERKAKRALRKAERRLQLSQFANLGKNGFSAKWGYERYAHNHDLPTEELADEELPQMELELADKFEQMDLSWKEEAEKSEEEDGAGGGNEEEED